mmetsp:Transcript_5535/g.11526  ORF Transcript_5535/g.11526 Transcript_5535/m.11526 type:complete len:246 (+) Transcript_5535:2919-3656(+)
MSFACGCRTPILRKDREERTTCNARKSPSEARGSMASTSRASSTNSSSRDTKRNSKESSDGIQAGGVRWGGQSTTECRNWSVKESSIREGAGSEEGGGAVIRRSTWPPIRAPSCEPWRRRKVAKTFQNFSSSTACRSKKEAAFISLFVAASVEDSDEPLPSKKSSKKFFHAIRLCLQPRTCFCIATVASRISLSRRLCLRLARAAESMSFGPLPPAPPNGPEKEAPLRCLLPRDERLRFTGRFFL